MLWNISSWDSGDEVSISGRMFGQQQKGSRSYTQIGLSRLMVKMQHIMKNYHAAGGRSVSVQPVGQSQQHLQGI